MNLLEHEGKALFARHAIAIPRGTVARSPAAALDAARELGASVGASAGTRPGTACMIKAQLAAGGRGKAGLVRRVADTNGAALAAADLLANTALDIDTVLIEECVPIAAECYLAIRVDDVAGAPVVLASMQGGVEVEDHATAVARCHVDVREGLRRHHAVALWKRAGAPAAHLTRLAETTVALWRAFAAEEADLMEINPLALTADGGCVALDAKVSLDDAAAARHPDRQDLAHRAGGTALERRAARLGVNSLIELGGEVAIISTGASFGMLAFDRLNALGARPANYMDMGGASSVLAREKIVRLMADHVRATPGIRAMLIVMIQTSKPIMNLVRAIRSALDGHLPACPVHCWIGAAHMATRDCPLPDALAALEECGIRTHLELDAALAAVAAVVGAAMSTEDASGADGSNPANPAILADPASANRGARA